MNNSECEGVHISVCGSKEKMGEDLLPSSTSMLSLNGCVMSGKQIGWKQALVLG